MPSWTGRVMARLRRLLGSGDSARPTEPPLAACGFILPKPGACVGTSSGNNRRARAASSRGVESFSNTQSVPESGWRFRGFPGREDLDLCESPVSLRQSETDSGTSSVSDGAVRQPDGSLRPRTPRLRISDSSRLTDVVLVPGRRQKQRRKRRRRQLARESATEPPPAPAVTAGPSVLDSDGSQRAPRETPQLNRASESPPIDDRLLAAALLLHEQSCMRQRRAVLPSPAEASAPRQPLPSPLTPPPARSRLSGSRASRRTQRTAADSAATITRVITFSVDARDCQSRPSPVSWNHRDTSSSSLVSLDAPHRRRQQRQRHRRRQLEPSPTKEHRRGPRRRIRGGPQEASFSRVVEWSEVTGGSQR